MGCRIVLVSENQIGDVADDSLINQLKKELKSMKDALPINLDNGVTIINVRLLEKEKVIENTIALTGVKSMNDSTIQIQKQIMAKTLLNRYDSASSLIRLMKDYGFKYNYIYTTPDGDKLCEISITKDDLK
ncbi:MAG: hypothetical protein LBQ50_07285 [Planctomycetaceae bacterium]|nr:hypothetical protein [Planctomycetaceae bacterium]